MSKTKKIVLAISLVARIPSVLSSTFGGHLLGEGKYRGAVLLYGITGIVSLIGMWLYNRILRKKQASVSEKKER